MTNSTHKEFELDGLLERLKIAAAGPDAAKTVRSIIEVAISDPAEVIANMPEFEENDVILHEDDAITVYHSRFMPGTTVPPHDHQMSAIICVYRGSERNDFFENDPGGGLRKSGAVELFAGDVFSIGPSAIHTVTCTSKEPCCGIHVYLGSLSTIERSLFEVKTGATLPFSDENYSRMIVKTN